jgi:hypothetical protein
VQHRRPSASDNFTVDTRDFNWRKIPISNNVGGVKMFSGTLRHPLRAERHFALVEICQANLGLASNRCGSGTQSDPTISSIATSIMITTSNSPAERGAGCPIITAVIYCTPWRFPGSPACEPSCCICS